MFPAHLRRIADWLHAQPEGWVTRAIGAICREAHWTTYYKLIERAQVPVADVSIRLLQLVQQVFPAEGVNLIIDDTLVPRCAKTGPGIGIKHNLMRMANLAPELIGIGTGASAVPAMVV